MKNILITLDNNVLFRLVINMSRSKAVSFGADVISQYDRDWFYNAIISAIFAVDEVLLPITTSNSSFNQNEIRFTLLPIGNTSVEHLASLIEKSLVTIAYKQWCQGKGLYPNDEDYILDVKHIVLGVGIKFNRKNEK